MLPPSLKKNDKAANIFIYSVSIVVFLAVTALGRITINVSLPFNAHSFAAANAFINAIVSVLLVAGLATAKQKKYKLHKNIMLAAIFCSVLFLLSYICHHLFTEPTSYPEKGIGKTIYYILLFTHIPLAGLVLPFILFAAYRALIGEYSKHKKIVRYTWPIWWYVAVTGVIIYIMISPYYAQ
jgi:putative membrane protein